MTLPLIMDKWLDSIRRAGSVDISADIDPCADEFQHEAAPLPERVGCAFGSVIEDDEIRCVIAWRCATG